MHLKEVVQSDEAVDNFLHWGLLNWSSMHNFIDYSPPFVDNYNFHTLAMKLGEAMLSNRAADWSAYTKSYGDAAIHPTLMNVSEEACAAVQATIMFHGRQCTTVF